MALREIHDRPSHSWTLVELARVAGASRSIFSERFQQSLATPPMQYLRRWRMLLAARLLAGSHVPLTRIAEEVGYRSDTAFSRAFRREYGAPPAAWRRAHMEARTQRTA
jgi:AraC-like DNA-binding protein